MNPFNNRWALLGIVAMFLVVVAELVGPDGGDGVLSRAAGTGNVAANGEPLPPGVVQVAGPAVDAADETPEEDQPQIAMPDSADVVDAEDGPPEEIEEPQIEPDAMGDPSFDDSGGEFTDDSGE
jgi:hypothetical protein